MPDESLPNVKGPSERRNWALAIFFAVSAILGFFPVSNPISQTRQSKFRLINILTLLSIIQLLYPALLFLDYVVKDGFNPGLSSTHRFSIFILHPAYPLGSTVIRINCILNCKQTIKLIQNMVGLRAETKFLMSNGTLQKEIKW